MSDYRLWSMLTATRRRRRMVPAYGSREQKCVSSSPRFRAKTALLTGRLMHLEEAMMTTAPSSVVGLARLEKMRSREFGDH